MLCTNIELFTSRFYLWKPKKWYSGDIIVSHIDFMWSQEKILCIWTNVKKLELQINHKESKIQCKYEYMLT